MGTRVGEWNRDLRCIEVDLTVTTGIQDVVTMALPNVRPVVVALTQVINRATGAPEEVPVDKWESCGPDGRVFTTVLPGGPDGLYRIRAARSKGTCADPGEEENDTSTPTGLIEPTRGRVAHWIWDFGTPGEEEVHIVIMSLDDEQIDI